MAKLRTAMAFVRANLSSVKTLVRAALAYYVRYLIWTLGLLALGGVIVLLVWIGATGDDQDAGEVYQPVLTEDLASSLAFTSVLSSGETIIACGLESSVLPDDGEVVYTSDN
ncbi:MAG: hypothetical protein IIB89_05690, partial [Chloroflexi bacterium]|nr:hypothetical protein [Chloroflexota bacterium]